MGIVFPALRMDMLLSGLVLVCLGIVGMGLIFLLGTEIFFTLRDRCMPWRHKYKIKGAWSYWLDSDWRMSGDYTDIAYQCDRCNKVKVKMVKGRWKVRNKQVQRREENVSNG